VAHHTELHMEDIRVSRTSKKDKTRKCQREWGKAWWGLVGVSVSLFRVWLRLRQLDTAICYLSHHCRTHPYEDTVSIRSVENWRMHSSPAFLMLPKVTHLLLLLFHRLIHFIEIFIKTFFRFALVFYLFALCVELFGF
jgi:hypothetical protein